MSKLEKTKALIDYLKAITIALLIGLFGMISYLVVNIEKLVFIQILLTAIGIFTNMIMLSILIKISIKKINELEDLWIQLHL